jgi:ADP-ribose pyrophosphatase YjhB (NUDIX family)
VSEPAGELLNVYDVDGNVVGTRGRDEAKAAGLVVGAINVLLVSARGEVLLQRRPRGKENGGRWDKSVGGHVGAGETFDDTARRECGEELFDDPRSTRVVLVTREALREECAGQDLGQRVVMAPLARQLNLRDIRIAPDGGLRNVTYHVGVYVGRTDIPISGFRPQPSEIDDLAYFSPGVVDLMLLRGQLAPNMAFAWLAHGQALLALAPAH